MALPPNVLPGAAPAPVRKPAPTITDKPLSKTSPEDRKKDIFDESNQSITQQLFSNETFYQQGLEPITKMQNALIQLSKDMMSHDLHNKETADPFMNFLAKSMNKAVIKGQQFVTGLPGKPTHIDSDVLTHNTTPNDELKNVLSTIQFIGSAKAPTTPDGMWGDKTNKSLQQAYALGHALMQIQRDMNLPTDYTKTDLKEFQQNIPQNANIGINIKIKLAPILTQQIDKLHILYNSFKKQVLDNPKLNTIITGEKPLLTAQEPELPASRKDVSQYPNIPIQVNINNKDINITPQDLVDINSFKKYLTNNSKTLNFTQTDNNKLLSILLTKMKTKLNAQGDK